MPACNSRKFGNGFRYGPDSAQPPQKQGAPAKQEHVHLSSAGKANAAEDSSATTSTDETGSADPRLKLIRSLVELLTGRRIEVFDASAIHATDTEAPVADAPSQAGTQAPPAGWGMTYDRHESYSEAEQTTFSASGTINTADGHQINFSLQLSMSRSYHEESNVSLRLGDAARKTDPLILNFSGTAAQLTDQRFAFDLNADGQAEQINVVAPGSGFLVFDRNGDGKINDGRELFGPTSNDGFQELGALDSDQNGWIDESDPAFEKLQIWTPSTEDSNQLQSLAAAGVGAISLSRISTPFDIKNNDNVLLGQIRNSGIFLQESGAAGTIQQVDLTA